ncbi:MAG: Cupin 2 conserved barrel domain protein [Solirubrobacterales bacterium]|nr:Cupin 2 conserved barrel domain protein [Solirubrobacterales bacterium]
MGIRVMHRDSPDELLPMIASDARLVVWPGTGADEANMNFVRMQPGEANVPHVHRRSEDTIFVLEGNGTVADLSNGAEIPFGAGQVVHVPPGIEHQLRADRGAEIVSVGGPCPADLELLSAAGLWPREG